jgi:copper(I)-binding protein
MSFLSIFLTNCKADTAENLINVRKINLRKITMQNFLRQQNFRNAVFLLLTFGCTYSITANSITVNAAATVNTVSIKDAWVRPTNPGQEVGAAYMSFLSAQDTTLVSVESDVTKSVEIHSMSMQNGIMKMRMMNTMPLAAGKPYKLAPGGYHLMLFDLKKPLSVGGQVNFIFTFKDKNKVEFKQSIKVPVQSSAEAASTTDLHNH